MTTYLLHGGATSQPNVNNDDFFRQFTELVDKLEVKILLCYWCRERSRWEELASRDSAQIIKQTNKAVQFHVVANVEDLFSKLDDYDVLYVSGGDADLIEPLYFRLSELKSKLNGKVYAGSSMGAFMAAEQYVLSFDSPEDGTVHQGLGFVPLQLLCHWDIETRKSEKINLLQTSSKQPIFVLKELEFITLYY